MTDKRKHDERNDDSSWIVHKTLKTTEEITSTSTTTNPASIRAASRKNRVYVFRDFIEKTYQWKERVVILDVAGGKGDLSWLLTNVDGMNSVVVDPRITKSQHILRSIHYLRDHPEQARDRAIPDRPTFQPLAALLPKLDERTTFDTPRHLRLLVDQELVTAVRDYQDNNDMERWVAYWERATQRALEAQPLGYKEKSANDPDNPTIQKAPEALQIILSTQLVLGFHPDQATDPAIDLAILLGVPYCIVPCCVFPQEFPDRKLADGSRVRNYTELIQYLKDKYHPKIGKLPFHFTETAKNLVLYSLPNDQALT